MIRQTIFTKYAVINLKYQLHYFGEILFIVNRTNTESPMKLNVLGSYILLMCDGKHNIEEIYNLCCTLTNTQENKNSKLQFEEYLTFLIKRKVLELTEKPYTFKSKRYPQIFISGEKGKLYPHQVLFEVTNKCNLNCKHCYKKAGFHKNEFLDKYQFYKVTDILRHKTPLITLSGGEAALHPDINEMISHLKNDFRVSLLTNAIDINNITDNVIQLLSYIQVSIYGNSENDYRKIANEEGCYEKLIQSLKRLIYLSIPMHVVIMVNDANISELEKHILMLTSLGIQNIKCNYPAVLGRAYDIQGPETRLSQNNVIKMAEYVKKKNMEGFHIECNADLNCGDKILPSDGEQNTCHAGEMILAVSQNGYVRPCTLIPENPFNICSCEEYFSAIQDNTFMQLLQEKKQVFCDKYSSYINNKSDYCLGIKYNELIKEMIS